MKTACLVALVAVTTTSCGVGLESLPLPAAGVSGATYTITATFSNALNLPERASVKLAGADIGEVQSMTAHDYTAVVTMNIKEGTVLPNGSTAELRTATPLGDVFVAVLPPAHVVPGVPRLHDGDAIPLQSTSAAATIEDVLATASLLVNGGAIRNLTQLVNGLGTAVGDRGDRLAELIDGTTRLVNSLSSRSGEITAAITQTSRLATVLSDQQATIHDLLASAAPAASVLADNTQRISDLIGELHRTTAQLERFPTADNTRSLVADLNGLSATFNDVAVDPNSSLDSLNNLIGPFMKITSSTAIPADGDIARIALGSLADKNHQADPGSRGPHWSDFRYLIGSLSYTINRIRDKVNGTTGPPP